MKRQHGLCNGGADLAGEDEGSTIFLDIVSVHVKPAGRDEFTASLTVRLRPDNAVHPRSILLELTDDSDLLFYHSLVLGEGDFHTLKSEQRLLVDFQSFPAQLVELLRRCMDSGRPLRGNGAGATASQVSVVASGAEALRMLACLECSASGDSTFSIVESTQFRELTHISLRLRQGSDEAVKQHLAGKLRSSRAEASDLAERLRASETTLEQLRRQCEEHAARARVAADERTQLEAALRATHQRELAEAREEHLRAVADLQRQAVDERTRIEADLRQSLSQALARATSAERLSTELQHQQESLTASGRSCQGRLETAEVQLRDTQQEAHGLREQTKQLEVLKFQHEREIGELKVQVSGLREQLSAKEQLVVNQASQVEQAAAQRRGLEEQLTSLRQQVVGLEEKFALSAQEISKGNQIIQSLHTNTKQAKAKLKLKATALAQQEKAILELGKAEEMSKHVLEEKENELSRARGKEVQLQQDIEELRKKLSEAHDVIKNNQDVIEFLQRTLTEKDLKSIPAVPGAHGHLPDMLSPGASKGLGLGAGIAGLGATPGAGAGFARTLGSLGLASTGLGSTGGSTMGTSAGAMGGLGGDGAASLGLGSGAMAAGRAQMPTPQPPPLSASAALTKQVEALLGASPTLKGAVDLGSTPAAMAGAAMAMPGRGGADIFSSPSKMDASAWAAAGREHLKGPVAYRAPERVIQA